MKEFLVNIIPNVVEYHPELIKSIGETFYMVTWSILISSLIGIPIGVLLFVTGPKNVLENNIVNSLLNKITNLLRAIPFIILVAAIAPLTRAIVGTTIGVKGAIVPLVLGVTPFIARQIEAALQKIDYGVIEAAYSMGQTPFEIITRVILKEGLVGVVNAITISIISLVGYSTMAGAIGAGGLGDFAIRYGYQFFKTDIMIVTIILIIILVSIIQKTGEIIMNNLTH